MIQHWDEDEYEVVYESRRCGFHLKNPGKVYAGCTCSLSMSNRRRTRDEIAAIKARREREREDQVLAEADAIRARRGIA